MGMLSVEPGSRRHEEGKTFIVIGGLLLVYLLIVLCWVGWDIRAGNSFIQITMLVVGIIAVALILIGSAMKHKMSM